MPSSRLRSLLAAVALSTVLLGACGDSTDTQAEDAPTTTTTAPASYPVSVVADQGQVTIPARPSRIVSLSPSLTEILYAIGAGDQVVAVDKFSDHPDGTPKTDLSGFRPNVEAIGGYQPDLVVLASDKDGIVDVLTNLDVPTLLLGSPAHLPDVYDQVTTLGAATGNLRAATELAETMREDLQRIAKAVPERDTPLRYFYEVSDTYHSVTSETFTGQLLRLVGLRSIADDAPDPAGGYPQLSAESVLRADPDLIFLAHAGTPNPTPAEVAGRPGWSQLAAVRNGRVIALDADLASRWGPRIVELLQAVVDALPAG